MPSDAPVLRLRLSAGDGRIFWSASVIWAVFGAVAHIGQFDLGAGFNEPTGG